MSKAGQFTTIETERLSLRHFAEKDTVPFFCYRTLPEISQFQGDGWRHFTLLDAAGFTAAQSTGTPGIPDTWFQIAIERRSTGTLIGDLGLHTLSDVRQAEIGFTIAPPHQHQGFALEAASALLHYLFCEQQLHRIVAVADTRNTASITLLEKLGMRREGLFKQSTWSKGAYTDECQYALLYSEFTKDKH